VQTFVNGEKRQDGTTDDLIFSISNLVKTLSEGTTLRPGDVIASGTPAGVGFGQRPVKFLKPGDKGMLPSYFCGDARYTL
jgi:2-keto-4-pentenoate hydratase/2-oxohepta-3-ene-1,7-dioic acid hydratase in catechol pathway